jgi:cupin superfamily acireductone dioxygenase involved in methionine salvage
MSEARAAQEAENKRNGKPNFRNGKKQGIKPQQTQSLNSDAAVPMLRFGASNNFDLLKRKVSIACMEKYKNLGRLIMDKQYYVPDAVNTSLYDLTNDQYDVEKGRLREAHKHRDKEINDM